MYDLIVLALRTDMTRVVTYLSGSESMGLAIPEIGISQSRHELSHHNGDPAVLASLTKSDVFLVQQFAYFLDQLKAVAQTEAASTGDDDGQVRIAVTVTVAHAAAEEHHRAVEQWLAAVIHGLELIKKVSELLDEKDVALGQAGRG